MFEYCITKPLGFIIRQIYNIVPNYGWAIIIFTILIKLILLPLQVKSQKSMKKQQKIQPVLQELQKKYANDKEKLQTETMKIYKENGVSMTGGCLPLLIQFPILIGLYRVIQRPLSYLRGVDFKADDVIAKVSDIVAKMAADPKVSHAVDAIKNLQPEELAKTISKQYEIQFTTWCNYLADKGEKLVDWTLNFKFFGLDLAKTPSNGFSALIHGDFSNMATVCLLIIPILAVLTTWYSMHQSQKMSGQTQQNQNNENDTATAMSKSMNFMMPLMTGYFTIILPSAMGIYWIVSSVMQVVTQFILNIILDKKEDDFVVKLPEKNRKNSKKRR